MVVAEAVEVFAVVLGIEGVVARRDTAFVDLVGIVGVLDLWSAKAHESAFPGVITSTKLGKRIERIKVLQKAKHELHCCKTLRKEHTQKSTSKFPAPPNSLSPT